MALKYKYGSKADIPEALAGHYVERDGAFVLSVEDLPTSGDTEALKAEQREHLATRNKLKAFEEIGTPEEISDRLAAAGKPADNAELLTARKRIRELEPFEKEALRLRAVEKKVKIDTKLREAVNALDPKIDREKVLLLMADKIAAGQIDIDDIGDLKAPGDKPISEYISGQAQLFGFVKSVTPGSSAPGNGSLANAPKYEEAKKSGDIMGMIATVPATRID